MSQELNHYKQVMEQVRPKLIDYLIEHKRIDPSAKTGKGVKQFLCPNPEHKEKTPSAVILPGGTKGYCHGCHTTFDIFQLHSWFQGAPKNNIKFVTDNLLPLCKKYGIEFQIGDISEEQRLVIDSHRIHTAVMEYLEVAPWNDLIKEYIEERGLTEEFCRANGIGVVVDPDAMLKPLRDSYTLAAIEEFGLTKKNLFGPTSVTFTLKDATGSVVGFISRDIKYKEKKQAYIEGGKVGRPPIKYDSSPEKNRLYYKKRLLFGFDKYVKKHKPKTPLYIVEGQFDWAVMSIKGISNCAALGGSVLTNEHISLMKAYEVGKVIFVLDGDAAGRAATSKLLLGESNDPGLLAMVPGISFYVVDLPDGHDPASYLLEHTAEEFKDLPCQSAFEWGLEQIPEENDPTTICETMLPFVLIESSKIAQELMLEALSVRTGISREVLKQELQRKENLAERAAEDRRQALVQDHLRTLRSASSREAVAAARDLIQRMEEIDKETSEDAVGIDETYMSIVTQEEQEREQTEKLGYDYGDLTHLTMLLNGSTTGTVLGFGGIANSGKTALMSQLALSLAMKESEKVSIIVQTIDDSRDMFVRRLVVQLAVAKAHEDGHPVADILSLNGIYNPKYLAARFPTYEQEIFHYRNLGYQQLTNLVRTGVLNIKDTVHGATLDFLERVVQDTIRSHSDKEIVVVLDNFHKLEGFPNMDERIAFKKRSSYLKSGIAQRYGATVYTTVEYKKIETGFRPKNSDISETGKIEYDFNFLYNMFNPLKAAQDDNKEDKCNAWHGSKTNKFPIVEGDCGKNKINELKGRRHFKFFPAQSRFECITQEERDQIEYINSRDGAEPTEDFGWVAGKQVRVRSQNVCKEDPVDDKTIPFNL